MPYTRIDGRQPNELRQISCSLGVQIAPMASVLVALGQYSCVDVGHSRRARSISPTGKWLWLGDSRIQYVTGEWLWTNRSEYARR